MIRLGAVISHDKPFSLWQKELLDWIVQQPDIQLCVLIEQGKQRPLNMASRILRAQALLERRLLHIRDKTWPRPSSSSGYGEIVKTTFAGAEGDSEKQWLVHEQIKSYRLDTILNLTDTELSAESRSLATNGVWTITHGDHHRPLQQLAGFWELIGNQSVIPIKLVQIKSHGEQLVIDKSYHFKHWSLAKNQSQVMAQCSILFLKNLSLKAWSGRQRAAQSVLSPAPERYPQWRQVIHYLVYFYLTLLSKVWQKLTTKYFGVRYRCWTLQMGIGTFSAAHLKALQTLPPPAGEFWADPFLFSHQSKTYVFFENFSYQNQIGKISCGEIVDDTITAVSDVIVRDYHLSYPFIFEEDGNIFMIPETTENQRLEIYICQKFPLEWSLHATAFEGECVADATYFRDDNDNRWLFVNKGYDGYFNDQLSIYHIDSLKLNKITPHRLNPVIVDARRARNAGPLFHKGNSLIRPSQNNSYGIYGYGLNLNRITKLSLDDYEEEVILEVTPERHVELAATHHLHQTETMFVLDAIPK